MPANKPTPEAMPQDELVLAAIDRGERHRKPEHEPGIHLAILKQHAGLDRGGWATLRLRPQLERLEAAKQIRRFKRRGSVVWTLTDAGRKRLADVQATGKLAPLPESPQHQQWREAHAIAAEHIGEFAEKLQALLSDAAGLLGAHETADSDTWHATGQRLKRACERMESASYCLHEWPEPDDSRPDTPAPRKAGLRSIHRFDTD